MFPNSRCVLPTSPAVSMGDTLLGETIFEFQNENESENVLHSTTGGAFMASARRLSSGSSGHFSNNTWRLPQNIQRTHSTVSEESTSPENNEQDMRVESVNTFNIELSRVSPLKESSDSGQGSSRSTGSQGSSFSADSTPSPSMHPERDSLVKMSVKNRLGIGMTPAATQVQENSRFNSRLLNPLSRNEEVRDLRRGLVKSVLSTTISISGVQQLGSIPFEKQPDLQPLVSKRDFGELDTIKESSRQTSANSEILQSRTQSRRTSDAGSGVQELTNEMASARRPSLENTLTRTGSKEDPVNKLTVLPKDTPSSSPVSSTAKKESSKEDSMNKLSVLPGVKANSTPQKDSDENVRTNANKNSSTEANKTALKAGDSKKAADEKIVIKKLITTKQTAGSTSEQAKDLKAKEVINKNMQASKTDNKEKTQPKTALLKESSVSDTKSRTEKVVNKPQTSTEDNKNKLTKPAAKATMGNVPQKSVDTTANVTRTVNLKARSVTKVEPEVNRTVCKPDSEKAKSAISSKDLSNKPANVAMKAESKDSNQPKKEVAPKPAGQQRPSDNSKPSQKTSPSSSASSNPVSISSPKPKPDVSSNTPSQKPETTKVQSKLPNKTTNVPAKVPAVKSDAATATSKMDSKGPNQAQSTNPQKLETAKPSLLKTNVVKVSTATTASKTTDSKQAPSTSVQKSDPAKASLVKTNVVKAPTAMTTTKPDSKDSKQAITSPRKLETATSSLIDSAPGPNVSKGKPSLSKSFNSSDRNSFETELRKAQEEIKKESPNATDVTAKTATTAKPAPNKQQTSNHKPGGESPAATKKTENVHASNKSSDVNKTASSTNKVINSSGKETTKQVPVVKTTSNASQGNKMDVNKNIKQQSNPKKRPEDSKTTSKNNANQNQKENIPKKQKVTHVSNSNSKSNKKPVLENKKKQEEVEEDYSDVESMEDVEEMLDNVTFVSEDEREFVSEDEKGFDNVVHIEIKTEEEMKAEEPKKEEKKDKLTSKQKLQNKIQTKKDVKAKAPQKSGISAKAGKVTVVNGKTTKSASQVSSKSNKVSVSAKGAQKTPLKVQQKQSKSAGQKPDVQKSVKSSLSGKHSLSLETLTESNPAKRTVVENTPVITDIMEVIKAVNKGVTPTPWRRSVSVEELSSSPRKKSTSPKRGSGGTKTRNRTSSERAVSGSKGKGQSAGKVTNQKKPVKKQSNVNADGFSTVSTKKGKAGKINKKQLQDLQLLSESERQTTAFITGHGWQIKTDRNETDDVIINDPLDSSDSSDEEMPDASTNLSPHHTMKLQKLNLSPLDQNVINNLANILSPLEGNTPRYLPDTMDTIKEFADSLKSNESGEISALLKESNKNKNLTGGEEGSDDNPPALPPKQSEQSEQQSPSVVGVGEDAPKLSESRNRSNELRSAGDGGVPPELPPKENKSKTDMDMPPELPPKQTDPKSEDLPPELPPKLGSSQKIDVDFSDPIKELPVTEQRTDGDGAEDLSYNSYKTNPELLKVFHIPDHYEEGRSSKLPRLKDGDVKGKDGEKLRAMNQQLGCEDQEKDNSDHTGNSDQQVEPSETESDISQRQERLKATKEDITSKPPLPKRRSARKKAHLRRINSEPCCRLDTSESESNEDDDEVFSPGRKQRQSRKTSLPEKSRGIHSPRSPRDIKRLTENTSLARYIREKQDAGEMLEETRRLEDLKELDEDEILRKEQLLNEHIQDMTINAMKEFNSLLSPIGESGESTSSPLRPPSSARSQVDHLGGPSDVDFLNKSLPMSEASEISAVTVRSEDMDTLVSEVSSEVLLKLKNGQKIIHKTWSF